MKTLKDNSWLIAIFVSVSSFLVTVYRLHIDVNAIVFNNIGMIAIGITVVYLHSQIKRSKRIEVNKKFQEFCIKKFNKHSNNFSEVKKNLHNINNSVIANSIHIVKSDIRALHSKIFNKKYIYSDTDCIALNKLKYDMGAYNFNGRTQDYKNMLDSIEKKIKHFKKGGKL